LRSRFGIFHNLDFYRIEDLARIITNSAKALALQIEASAAEEIARRSRGTPRIANRLLRRVRDHAQVLKIRNVGLATASKALDDLGIDRAGLDDLDRKVLKLVINTYNGGPVGVESLAASLNEEVDTIADTVEPYLLKAGYLKRTSRGRMTTRLAYEHFGIKYEKQEEMF
jgi:Holliday junction DNA helicase RuvB